MFCNPFDCFPRKSTLFLLFFKFQHSEKSVPFRGKVCFFNPCDCFPRHGTLGLLFFKFQNSEKSVPF